MEQIVDYKNDPGNGYTKTLLCFVQLFIVSNRTDTWYFANNNARHFAFDADERFLPVYQFAAEDNTKITHLDDFADRFLAKCTLGQMISKYMVLIASEQKLLMMRAYQIYAVKAIIDCIDQNCGNGYIWHTTGSGKTLTSFKASTLLKTNHSIHKCLFVVDRKDLDRQTREEFNRFQENCVEENTNTAALVRRLLSDDYADKVIVTTIQKLGLALDEDSKHNQQNIAQGRVNVQAAAQQLRDKRMVFIFDECHARSSARTTGPSRSSSRTPSSSASLAPRSLRTTRPSGRSRETSPSFEPPRTSSRKNSTPTPSPTRSRIGTSSASRRLLQAQGRPGPQVRPDSHQAGGCPGHPRQARYRDRRPTFQRAARYSPDQRRHRVLQGLQEAPGRTAVRRPRVHPSQDRRRLLAACGGQQRCPANPGGPSPGEGGQPARPRGQEDRA